MSDWTPSRIKGLRSRYAESQTEFCKRIGASVDALRGWEQGRGQPVGSAQMMLERVEGDLELAEKLGVPVDSLDDAILRMIPVGSSEPSQAVGA